MPKTLLKRCILALVVVSGMLSAIFWAPDTSFDDMRVKYGYGASQFLVLASGDRLHYRDQGGSGGDVLIFIHGTSASLHTWEPLIERLGDRYRLISLDLPGHGLTGANAARDYSREAMVFAIWSLMDYLSITAATLVGNSLGGSVAWRAALDRPERVRSLVLLAPSGAPNTTAAKSNLGFKLLDTSLGQAVLKKITPRAVVETSLLQTVVSPHIVTEAMVDRYWELLRLSGNRQALIDLANTPRDPHAWEKLSRISVPSLVIWGEEDGLLPATMAATFDREINDIRLVMLKNIGHLPMEEAVNNVADRIIAFCMASGC